MTGPVPFAPHPGFDPDALAARFAPTGRLQIRNLLPEADAEDVWGALARTRWRIGVNAPDRNYDIPEEALATIPQADRDTFFGQALARARTEFQFIYKRYPLTQNGEPHAGPDEAHRRLVAMLNAPAFIAAIRTITGDPSIVLADAQATLYEPGHFLTAHDDGHEAKKQRRAAFVLSMAKDWQAQYGGLLLFLGPDGHVIEGFSPLFNTLNLFRVPQMHCVSAVAPFAPRGRYSITGWFRAG